MVNAACCSAQPRFHLLPAWRIQSCALRRRVRAAQCQLDDPYHPQWFWLRFLQNQWHREHDAFYTRSDAIQPCLQTWVPVLDIRPWLPGRDRSRFYSHCCRSSGHDSWSHFDKSRGLRHDHHDRFPYHMTLPIDLHLDLTNKCHWIVEMAALEWRDQPSTYWYHDQMLLDPTQSLPSHNAKHRQCEPQDGSFHLVISKPPRHRQSLYCHPRQSWQQPDR